MSEQAAIRVGDIIAYTLRPSELPIHPDKLWYGKIQYIVKGQSGIIEALFVESIEEGYKGDTEYVYLDQIRSVQSSDG